MAYAMPKSESYAPNDASGGVPQPMLPPGTLQAFLLVSGLFFLWGVPNNLNDILIRQFMKSFVLTRFQAGLVQWAFYLGYFMLALPAGLLVRRRGYRTGLITGLLLFATGAFLFLPAANAGRYGFFLAALFVLASGLSFLETSANPFIAQLGATSTSEQRLNVAQAFNPVGAITGALVGTRFIFSGVELTSAQTAAMQRAGTYAQYLHQETTRVVTPYLLLGAIAVVWAIVLALTKFPTIIVQREHSAEVGGNVRLLLRQRHFLFALSALFVYVGAQVGTWSYFINYAQEYTRVPERTAGYLLTGTLVAFGLGRFSSAYLMRRMLPSRLVALYAAVNALLVLLGIFLPSWLGLFSILLTSFFMSIMFPTIFALGLKNLGPNTNLGGSMLVMTILGGGVLTLVMGAVAEHLHSIAAAFQVPLYAYLWVLAFALYMVRYAKTHGTMTQPDFAA